MSSCFDSIPQGPLLDLLGRLLTAESYTVSRHAEAKALLGDGSRSVPVKTTWKFAGKARAAGTKTKQLQIMEGEAQSRKGTVFVDSIVENLHTRNALLSLLKEHVDHNVIQMGKKYYRQKTGIPQGSVVSSLLCNFFYAELEREVLPFLVEGESMLCRLIDDFLLISTDRETAARFVRVMHAGVPEYGLSIRREKSRVNFDVDVEGVPITRLPAVTNFPYCGNAIHTRDLSITKDESRRQRNSKTSFNSRQYVTTNADIRSTLGHHSRVLQGTWA